MSDTTKILLIEDDTRLRNNLIEIFEIYNYKIHFAFDGLDGYMQALSIKPDIIICDLIMPKMTGFEFVESIKKSPLSQVPIILISGKKYFDDIETQTLARVSASLTKPFAIADLISIIEKYTKNTS